MPPSASPARRLVLVPSAAPHRHPPLDARLRRYKLARVESRSVQAPHRGKLA